MKAILSLAPGVKVQVLRGKYIKRRGEVQKPDADFVGFWWVWLQTRNGPLGEVDPAVLLSAGQLEILP